MNLRAALSSKTARFGSLISLVALATAALPVAAMAEQAPVGAARVPGCTIIGTSGPDLLVGGPGPDIICGLGGDDRLFGGGGADVLRGGPGADRLQGGSGKDVLRGDEGADVLRGGSGDDALYAGAGDDDARGGEGDDVVRGGTGDDDLSGGPGRDTMRAVDGAEFRDVVQCGSGEHDRAFADTQDVVSDNCESNSQNSSPVAVDDTYPTPEDTTLDLPVSGAGSPAANDSDPEGDALAVVAVSGAVGGTVVIAAGAIHFTPTSNLCGPTAGRFDYTVSDGHGGTDVGRVTVAITCLPDDPTAVDDLAMVQEDAAATPLLVLGNDNDPDGDALVITSTTQPSHGTVAITGGGSGLTYTPTANYCNQPPGSSPDTFTYTLTPGGSTATVTVLVLCVDDPPTAVDDAATVAQDAAATAIGVLANDTDIDGGPMSVASVTQPANGTVVNNGADVTYQPDAGYCNTPPGSTLDTFTYTLNGGSSASVSVTVTCPDSPPTAVNDSATVSEDAGATAIAVLTNDTDTDGGPKSVASVTQPANGTVVITGGGTGLTYQPDANYCNNPPGTTLDPFTYTLNGGSSATVTVTVTCVDDPPVAVGDSTSVAEDASATAVDVLGNDTDVDGGPISIASVTQPANGTVVITGGGTGLTYQPNANYCNNPSGTADTFTYTLTPGGSSATVSVTVDCTGDAPVVTTSAGSLAYTENDPATAIDAALTVTDTDAGASIGGATVSITSNFHSGEDVLALANAGTHSPIVASYNAGTGTLTLTGGASLAAYQSALRDVTYLNSSDGPSTATRTVTFTVTDDTALNGSGTRGIGVTAVNDPPTAVDDTGTTDEDTTLNVSAAGVLANDTDPDPADTKTVVELNGSATLTGTSTKGAAVTINANGSYSYNPGAVFQGLSTGESDTDTFTYTMQDAAGSPSTATVTVTIDGVSDAPTAVADTFDAIGNTGLFVSTTQPAGQAGRAITGSLLTNDTDPDTAHASLVVEPVTNATTTLGGTITILSDGTFSYQPDVGDTGVNDTFTYRVCDASPCNSGTVANATGTLNLPIAGQVWYVRNNQAAGGDGTSDTPFDTLLEAETASGTGDTTFVYDGDGGTTNLDTGYQMDASERLIGEVSGLSLDPDAGGPLPLSTLYAAVPGARPTLTATGEDVVALDDSNVVRGFQLDPSGAGSGVAGAAGDTGGATLDDLQIIDTGTAGTQPALELDGTTGTFDISSLTIDNSTATSPTSGSIGVRLNNAGTVNFAATGTISITTKGAKGLDAAGPTTNLGTGSVFDAITVTGSGTGAMSMSGTTGTTTFGNLALTTTSGAAGAFALSNAGTVTVSAGGTANVSATGGPAVDVSGTNGPTLDFDSVSSTNSAGAGINLSALGTGTFTASGGTLAGASGTAFAVAGASSGTITYPGAISDGTGNTASITGRTGGTVTLSGTLTDGVDANGGVSITSNSGGSTVLSGASKTFSTGTGTGVALTSNTGHTVSITNGGLGITATSGAGLNMGGGGTLNVSGAGNTITTGTGSGLVIDNSTIGASDATFQSVSTNGASVGIRANNTGVSGRLVVTGNGGTCTNADTSGCTGGTIQNGVGADDSGTTPAGTGIVLNSTQNPSFTRIFVHDHSNYGIRGTAVSGFTLANSVINGANGTNGTTPFDDSSVWFDNLTGSAAVSSTYVSGGFEDNFRVVNSSGSLNRITFTNDTFGSNGARPSNDAVLLETSSAASQLQATVTGSTFTSAGGDLLQFNHNGSGAGDLVLTGNAFSNSNTTIATGGGGLSLFSDGAGGNTTMSITGNSFRDAVGNALTIVKTTGTSTQSGTFDNNTVGVSGTANSGSAEGDGVKIQSVGQGTVTWAVTNNQIRGYNNFGVEVLAGGSASAQSGTINTTITGNTIAEPGTTAGSAAISKNGVHLNIGTVPGDTYQVCAAITGNSLASSGLDAVPPSGLGDVDVRLRQRQSTTIRLPGYGGASGDTAAVQIFVAGNNSTGSPVVLASASGSGGGFTGTGTSCP